MRSRATALEGRVFGLCVAAVHCVAVHLALEPLALQEEISREQLSIVTSQEMESKETFGWPLWTIFSF